MPNQHYDVADLIDILEENGYYVQDFDAHITFSENGFMLDNAYIIRDKE